MAGNEKNPPNPPKGSGKPPANPWDLAFPIPDEPEPMILDDSEDSGIDFGGHLGNVHEGASGVIPLADLAEPASSHSIVSWAEVIRQQRELSDGRGPGELPLMVDSVSDKDMLRHIEPRNDFALPPAPPKPPVDSEEDIPTLATPIFAPGFDPQEEVKTLPTPISANDLMREGDSSIMLDSMLPTRQPQTLSGSSVRFDIMQPPSDAGGVISPIQNNFLPGAEEFQSGEGSTAEMEPPEADLHSLLFASVDPPPNPAYGSIAKPPRKEEDPDVSDHSSILEILLGDGDSAPSTNAVSSGADEDSVDLSGHESDPQSTTDSNIFNTRRGGIPTQAVMDLSVFEQAVFPSEERTVSSQELMGSLPPAGEFSGRLDQSEFDHSTEMISTSGIELPDFDQPMDSFNPEELVDLYSEGPTGKNISDSGSLQVDQNELDAAMRRTRLIESSAIDLSSHPSVGGLDLDLPLPPASRAPESGNIEFSGIVGRSPSQDRFNSDFTGEDVDLSGTAPNMDLGQYDAETGNPEFNDAMDAIDLNATDITNEGSMILPSSMVGRKAFGQNPAKSEQTPSRIPAPMAETADGPTSRRSDPDVRTIPTPKSLPDFGPKPGKGRLLVSGLLGLALGAGTVAGLFLGDLLPKSGEAPGNSQTKQTPDPVTVTPPQTVAAVQPRQFLELGDPAKALKAIEEAPGEATATNLAVRGQARWLAYLQNLATDNGALDPNAEAIRKAREDLKAAAEKGRSEGTPEAAIEGARAILFQGLIEESLGNFDNAATLYTNGQAEFSGDAQAILQTALTRLNLVRPAPGLPVSVLPVEKALLGLTILLQADPAIKTEATEAGFQFWDALMLANSHQYAEARKSLKIARDLHEKNRLKKAGRGLNPLSDPLEQIFLRSCDELAAYWTLKGKLYEQSGAAEIVKAKGFPALIDDVIGTSATAKASLTAAIELLKPEKLDDKTLPDALKKLIEDRKTAETLAKDAEAATKIVAESLKKEGFDDPKLEVALGKLFVARKDADDKLKVVAEALKKAGATDPDSIKAIAALATSRTQLETTLQSVTDRLKEAKLVGENPDGPALVAAVNSALTRSGGNGLDALVPPAHALIGGTGVSTALVLSATSRLGQFQDQLAVAKAEVAKAKLQAEEAVKVANAKAEEMIKTGTAKAEEMLKLANAKVEETAKLVVKAEDMLKKANAEAEAAMKLATEAEKAAKLATEAEKVAKLAVIKAEEDAKAEMLKAETAVADLKKKHAAELVAQAEELAKQGTTEVVVSGTTPKDLLAQIEAALKKFPAEKFPQKHADLLIRRSTLKLDSKDFAGAEEDVLAAAKVNPGPDADLALGAVLEESGNRTKAKTLYQKLAETLPAGSPAQLRALEGVGRLLLPPKDKAAPVSKLDPDAMRRMLMLTIIMVGQVSEDDPKSIEEALKIGQQLIDQKQYQGHFLRAEALLAMKKPKEALQEYVAGLEKLKQVPRAYETLLRRIVERQPAQVIVKQPTIPTVPPVEDKPAVDENLASRLYARGVQEYYRGDYTGAEASLEEAIRNNSSDARFYYFLGLSHWYLGRPDLVNTDLTIGANLEKKGLPLSRDISEALSRVQGQPRQLLNQFRP